MAQGPGQRQDLVTGLTGPGDKMRDSEIQPLESGKDGLPAGPAAARGRLRRNSSQRVGRATNVLVSCMNPPTAIRMIRSPPRPRIGQGG